jgi:uncharacterized coiled-coil protein SlyX
MHVIELSIRNRGIITAREIDVNGNNLVVSGATGTGKTTIITLLWDILKNHPKIRMGTGGEEMTAIVESKYGLIRFSRVNTPGKSKITVIDEMGEILGDKERKKLLSVLSANPLSLFEKTGKDRVEFLLRCSSIDMKEFTRIKSEREKCADERTISGQLVKNLSDKVGTAPEEAKYVDTALHQQNLKSTNEYNWEVKRNEIELKNCNSTIEVLNNSICELEKKIAEKRKSLQRVEDKVVDITEWLDDNPKKPTDYLEETLNKATENNEKARIYNAWLERYNNWFDENKRWCGLTDLVKEHDKNIKSMLEEADFGHPKINVRGETIYYGDFEFDSLGTSDQILCSSILAAKQIIRDKNAVKILRIDRGESMDLKTQKKVIEECNKIGVQVFISVVDRYSEEKDCAIDIIEYQGE